VIDQVGDYLILDEITKGEVSTLYRAIKGGKLFALKVANPGREGMIAKEASVLTTLLDDCDPRLVPYLPEFHETLVHDDQWVNVFTYLEDFYSLKQVLARYPGGIGAKDMAWMFRRLLVVLGFAYDQQFVHGAIVPDHVMIHPEMHGLVLVDWCYSTMDDLDSAHRSLEYEDWYPPKSDGHALDLNLAARTMLYVTAGDPVRSTIPPHMPREFRPFFNALTMPAARPVSHPWEVQRHFDDLLERLFGPRKFRPFSMT
jgi:hypothetical protein